MFRLFTTVSQKIKSMKECKNLKNSEMAIENNSFPIMNWKGDKRPCVSN
jgi:hypothetical protein